MKNNHNISWLFVMPLWFLVTYVTNTSAQVLAGKILDEETSTAIPFASIFSSHDQVGTVTNEQGEFVLQSIGKNDTLIISHISYHTVKMPVTHFNPLWRLKPKTILLAEVVVDDQARVLMIKAFENVIKTGDQKSYGKAFYRQITRNDDSPTEMHEIFYSLESTNSGVNRQVIDQARYALKKRKEGGSPFVHFNNFSSLMLGSNVKSSLSAEKKPILIPLMPGAEDFYIFSINERFVVDANNFISIHFEPMDALAKPALRGDVILDEKTTEIYRFDAEIKNGLGAEKMRTGSGKIVNAFNHRYHFIFDFKKIGSAMQINYMEGASSFDFKIDFGDSAQHHVDVKAILMVFQRGIQKPRKLQEADLGKKDIDEIKKEKYSSKFWKDNPIVKLTPVETEIIKSFESSGFFGNAIEPEKQKQH